MSRLYGRAFDVYQVSSYLKTNPIPDYIEEKEKITHDELIDSSAFLSTYIPQEASDYLISHPAIIMKSILISKSRSALPTKERPNGVICYKGLNYKEEHKREYIFFLGCLLSDINSDELPKENNIACEYGEIIPLLLEYLYLKEAGKEDRFSKKHLYTMRYYADKYRKAYENYHKKLVTSRNSELDFVSESTLYRREKEKEKNEQKFLSDTFKMVVAYSSIDGALQLIDRYKSEDEIKDIIKELFENKNNNRQEIISDKGIETFGYKTLRKEIDRIGVRK